MPERMVTVIGVAIGGLRVPQQALAQHLALRSVVPLVRGGGPLIIPALAESAPIDILRGPSSAPIDILRGPSGLQRQPQVIDIAIRNFAPLAMQRLQPGSATVSFDATAK